MWIGASGEAARAPHVIAGANRVVRRLTAEDPVRPDVLGRRNLWTFTKPPLRTRPEALEPSLTRELARREREVSVQVGFKAGAYSMCSVLALRERRRQRATFRSRQCPPKCLCSVSDATEDLDPSDLLQLAELVRVCRTSPTPSAASPTDSTAV